MCFRIKEDGLPCGEVEDLEFHEQFGESKGTEIKIQQRTLRCIVCHSEEHGRSFPEFRKYPSRLQEDVSIEIIMFGGLYKWMEKFDLHEFGRLL